MNDWWDYLEHGWFGKNGQKGSEKKNHKYYTRVPTGTKDGHNVYRYFYSKEDYAAYIRSGKQSEVMRQICRYTRTSYTTGASRA